MRIESHTSAPDSPARNRSTSATSGGKLSAAAAAPRRRCAPPGSAHPGLLAEQDAEAPVHDIVVVDDQHPQLAVGVEPAGGCAERSSLAPPGERPAGRATSPRPGAPKSTMPPCWSASNAARRRPIPGRGPPGATPSLRTSRLNVSSSPATTPRPATGWRAWRCCATPRPAPTGPAAPCRPAPPPRRPPTSPAARPGAGGGHLGGQRGAGVGGAGPVGARARCADPSASCISTGSDRAHRGQTASRR